MKIGYKTKVPTWQSRLKSIVLLSSLQFILLYCFKLFVDDFNFSIPQIVFQSLFFGIGMTFLLPKVFHFLANYADKKIKPELSENEVIEIEGPANLLKGIEGVGGKIFLTNKNFIFKAHKLNIQSGQTNIAYGKIYNVSESKTIKVLDNGINIKTKEGGVFEFIVNERSLWIEKLIERVDQ